MPGELGIEGEEWKYYPGQKNWNSRAHVTQARDLSSMHAPMFGLRACFNFFGQGSRLTCALVDFFNLFFCLKCMWVRFARGENQCLTKSTDRKAQTSLVSTTNHGFADHVCFLSNSTLCCGPVFVKGRDSVLVKPLSYLDVLILRLGLH